MRAVYSLEAMKINEFIHSYPAKPAQKPALNGDENRQLTAQDGVRILVWPPPLGVERKVPTKSGDPGCHLWVIVPNQIPFLAEKAPISPPLTSGVVKHTNLTGGNPACCGGEVWFDPAFENLLYVNGCSGRYGPDTPEQLVAVEDVFRALGYSVSGFGWDPDAHRPAKVFRP